MTPVEIRRGYTQTFTITVLNTVLVDARVRITRPNGAVLRIAAVAGDLGQVLSLAPLTDSRGTHTALTVTMPPAATRWLADGAVNAAEIEALPMQSFLGALTLSGVGGLNDD